VDFAIGQLSHDSPGDMCQPDCYDSCNNHDCIA
jgi:hypothetical protein